MLVLKYCIKWFWKLQVLKSSCYDSFNSSLHTHFLYPGSGIIAALSIGRNAVAVEIDHWQFLHSQIRAIEVFSSEGADNPSTSSETAGDCPTELVNEERESAGENRSSLEL